MLIRADPVMTSSLSFGPNENWIWCERTFSWTSMVTWRNEVDLDRRSWNRKDRTLGYVLELIVIKCLSKQSNISVESDEKKKTWRKRREGKKIEAKEDNDWCSVWLHTYLKGWRILVSMYLSERREMSSVRSLSKLLKLVVSSTSMGLEEMLRWTSPGTNRHKFLGTSGNKFFDKSSLLTRLDLDRKWDEMFEMLFPASFKSCSCGRGRSVTWTNSQSLISSTSKEARGINERLFMFRIRFPAKKSSFSLFPSVKVTSDKSLIRLCEISSVERFELMYKDSGMSLRKLWERSMNLKLFLLLEL